MEQILADTKKAVAEMNRVVSPGEQTRDFYRKQGAEAERERIIKLLEGIETYPNGWDYDDPFSSVIALIKGEK